MDNGCFFPERYGHSLFLPCTYNLKARFISDYEFYCPGCFWQNIETGMFIKTALPAEKNKKM